ncbi:histone H1-like repetitive region-containing protein [Streptomyces sp. ISL-98]|uniref:TraR/DksA family transcriptional regulator n=1 Tax=Streptomyces sp. ISL-98 TaxID=2819192 RepID=UPI001BEA93C5|nr:histone H1-like repetitive region-containing protein [Streptomyces sp. ISL-98]MBT2504614.1 histone H1-like repetitive region-containing protein [Streptomyces sp. ISL-98]
MVAKKTAAQQADGADTEKADVAKKVTAEKSAAKTTAAKRTAKKTVAKKAAEVTEAAVTNAQVTKAQATKAPVTKAPAKKAPAQKAPAKKAPAKKAPAKKAAAKRAAPAAKGAAQAAEETGAQTVVAKKTPSRTSAAKKATAATATAVPPSRTGAVEAAPPGELAVRPGEEPWTPEEVAEAWAVLMGEVSELKAEIAASEQAVTGLMRDSGDGAGDDQADTGTKNISREHELALAASARERLEQTERALGRLDSGTYGLCEICGKPIGKARMQAFPRATLCVEDKQKQERRY